MTYQMEFDPALDVILAPTEDTLAQMFVNRHKDKLRYVSKWGQWLRYHDGRWKEEQTLLAFDLAREVCREINQQSKPICSAKTIAAVERIAKAYRQLAATVDQWDTDPWLLNTPGGVIDLRTGARRPHSAEDYMTKITAVAPDASCSTPLWDAFLKKVTNNDEELIAYLARVMGYALTGITNEHALFFIHGPGRNGKGVFLNTTSRIVGEYHRAAPIETFTESKGDRHPTELAMLRGARLVTAAETEEGRCWAESRIKSLTGGDPIPARFMRQDFFEYVPQFKLIITGNHKPALRSVDEAISRRFNLIPFTVIIPENERDTELVDKLKDEWPGILQWMINGCVAWRNGGLVPPNAVTEATRGYLESENAFKLWLEDCCRPDAGEWTSVDVLFTSWKQWCEAGNLYPLNKNRLSQKLVEAGFLPVRRDQRGFAGLTIFKAEPPRAETRERNWEPPF